MPNSPPPALETERLLFPTRRLVWFSVGFFVLVGVLQRVVLGFCHHVASFDCPDSWPISIFAPVWPTPKRVLTAIGALLLFWVLSRWWEKVEYRLAHIILAGLLLICATTLIQGWQIGFYAPISGSAYTGKLVPIASAGQEYYQDVLRIDDPQRLLLHYNEEQRTLNQHTFTHPPGAIFLFYFLLKIFRHPGLVAFFIALVAVSFSALFIYRLLETEVDPKVARYCTLLYLLIPAIQIYYLATLDALIATVLLGFIYCFRRAEETKYLILSAVLLIASFLLTFVSLFILPVLVLFDLWHRRSLRRAIIVLASLLVFHLLAYWLVGYNALVSFHTASHYENPNGFMLFVAPVNYLFTRLEDIFELAVFLGPWLLILIWRGFKEGWAKRSALYQLSLLGIGTLLAMFATGAFRTGETGRAAMFVFAYFLIPIALIIDRMRPNRIERLQLATIVFMQTVLMQFIGNYFY